MASHVTDHHHNNNELTPPVVILPNYTLVNPNLVPVRYVVNPAAIAQLEVNRSINLQQDEGLVPSGEEERKRNDVIRKLKEIVFKWIKSVASLRRLPQNNIRAASATILTYGSYGLGVYNAESDIDALCVGPWFATLTEDFFIGLHNMLANRVEVSDIHCVKDAKVPLMRFKFEGISIDLPYAQLQVTTVPENVDILNPLFLHGIDETSWKSLSGVRANNSILQLVPNAKIFQELLRCVKHWAKRRGVYGNLFGFFGGVHLAVLAAFVCQSNPNVSLAGLVTIFFKTFALWPWPTPVILQQGMMVPPRHHETRSLMPIQLPSSPHEYCHSNVTTSTFMKIIQEFRRGYRLTQDLFKFDWRNLFEPYPYSKNYQQFLKLCLSASNQDDLGDWIGWVKSRFPGLLQKLEEFHAFYDPNPAEYSDATIQDPNVVFYWGIVPGLSNILFDLNSVQREFKKYLGTGSKGVKGKISLSVIPASQLPKNLLLVDNPHVHSSPTQMIPVYTNPVPYYTVGYLTPGHPGSGHMS
ncbi:poly(A) polymerase 3 [Artemisia annua]|uniref:polynucleotide adenylyltransferase n=1 Tax=Artemisia annua TaxID=35608 RepID=A0A2U1QPD6_ARTAN|nr:poly(A) polymerase 3 [Artemisia annua]